MEKVTLFFCDICGTFASGLSYKFNCDEIKRFIDNLNKLVLYNGTDKLIFSFVTTEDLDTVVLMEKQLKMYINDNIFIEEHIYFDGVNNVNKPNDILAYIKELESKYNIDDNVYYADDSEFYHFLLNELKKYIGFEYNIQSIIPKNNGLRDVNVILESLLDKCSNKKNLPSNHK